MIPLRGLPTRNSIRCLPYFLLATASASCATPPRAVELVHTQEAAPAGTTDAEALAKKLSNPVAALISVPFQLNYDQDIGPTKDGERLQLNLQPVVPITLSADWNLISRTILPLIDQDDVPVGNDESGLGDVVQSAFFSPKEPTAGGWIWGAGPVLLLPTASDDVLGADKWGLGPTAVVLKQIGPWTVGGLANHLWSVAGDDDRSDISATFVQPFVTYTTSAAWTYALNTEATYDWKGNDWGVPLNASVSKLTRLGKLPVSLGGGLRYWAEHAENGPEGLAFRVSLTLLFPR
jgi:hypothetical protein